MEHDAVAALRKEIAERVIALYGDERAVEDRDFIDLMTQSLARVYKLEVELFAALEMDGEA
jgi:hypothetical protein